MNLDTIGMLGYGEVGKTFALGLKAKPGVQSIAAWDLVFNQLMAQPGQPGSAGSAYDTGLVVCASVQDVCAQSSFLISAVTASNTLAVALEAARSIRAGSVFLDLNSASPSTKQQCATAIEAAGAHYVEAGVMTSVPPYGIKVPMLLGGPQAQALAQALNAWGMNAQTVSDKIGVASAIKMCRSVMIKGLEALVIESYTTARAYGVEDYVLPTLQETFPSIDWHQQGAYFFSRVVQHGKRRAQEMRESANTVSEAGFEPLMAAAIASKQQWVADHAARGVFAGLGKDALWQDYADCLIGQASGKK